MKSLTLGLTIALSFFLGRESKELKTVKEIAPTYLTDSFQVQSFNNYLPLALSDTTKVYRCGQSKIYHPTTSHSSFKRCKSKVYKLTVERAKQLGMRHCKCNN